MPTPIHGDPLGDRHGVQHGRFAGWACAGSGSSGGAVRRGLAAAAGCSGGCGSRPVSRVLSKAVIHLRRTSPCACSDLPGSGAGNASPPASAARSPTWSCSGRGLPCHRCHHRRGALLPHLFTLTAHPFGHEAVCFLWHFPWARAPQALPGALPCGARTFLRPDIRSSDCPVDSRSVKSGTSTLQCKTTAALDHSVDRSMHWCSVSAPGFPRLRE